MQLQLWQEETDTADAVENRLTEKAQSPSGEEVLNYDEKALNTARVKYGYRRVAGTRAKTARKSELPGQQGEVASDYRVFIRR